MKNVVQYNNTTSSLQPSLSWDGTQKLLRTGRPDPNDFLGVLAFKTGKILRKAYDALPNIGLPTAKAETEVTPDIILRDDEALRLVEQKTTIYGDVTEAEREKIMRHFLDIVSRVRNEGPLTKANVDIFIQFNKGAKFALHADPETQIVDDNTAALYELSSNTVNIKADPNDLYVWLTMEEGFRHEISHAADDTRGNKAFQKYPYKIKRPPYHNMDDEDKGLSEQLISNCIKASYKAKDAVKDCMEKGKGCKSRLVKDVEKYNDRQVIYPYLDKKSIENIRKMVPVDAKIGGEVSRGIGTYKILENTKKRVLFATDDPKQAFVGYAGFMEHDINRMKHESKMLPGVKDAEYSKLLNQLLNNNLKRKLCPELYGFERTQDAKFEQKINAKRPRVAEL